MLAPFTPHNICETDPSVEYSNGSMHCHPRKVLHCLNVSSFIEKHFSNTGRHLCYFQPGAITKRAAMYILVHVLQCTYVHVTVGYKMSGIASYWTHVGLALAHIAECQFSKAVPIYIPSSST